MARGRGRDANTGRGRGGAPANPELQAAVAAELERLMPGMLQDLVGSIRSELEAVIGVGRGGGRGYGRGAGGRGHGRGRGQPANGAEDESEAGKSVGEFKKSPSSADKWKRSGNQIWAASAKKVKVGGKKSEPELKQSLSCSKCGRAHGGECRVGSSGCYKCGKPGHLASACNFPNTCFNCGQPGHVARACPKERKVVASSSKTDGRAFTITKEQAEQDPDVVYGTFLVNGFTAYVLFDSGASISFISLSFVKLAGVGCSVVPETFSVSAASNKSVVIRSALKEGRVKLEGCVFTATLYVISLGEF